MDNFILDGEIFALRMGLALLKYFEKELVKLPHNQIMNLLMDMTGRIEEEELFAMVERIEVNKEEYRDELIRQKWSFHGRKAYSSLNMLQ